MKTEAFDALVETICADGCRKVYQTISQLENNAGYPDSLEPLSDKERQQVLEELKSIMDVYDGNMCSI